MAAPVRCMARWNHSSAVRSGGISTRVSSRDPPLEAALDDRRDQPSLSLKCQIELAGSPERALMRLMLVPS